MIASKRRSASTQAVSRKVEGNEPRNQYNRKDDALNLAEVNTGAGEKGKGCARFLGVGDHGMRDIKTTRQPGRPCRCFRRTISSKEEEKENREYAKQPDKGREAKGRQGVGSSNSTNEGG